MSTQQICVFGEVLFDHFPDGKRVLGGAPFNVAWHLQAFGESPRFLSRIGDDPEGEAIRKAMQGWGMNTAGLQTDPKQPTGRVDVSLEDGEPAYDIVHPCAYDAIEAETRHTQCDLLYHGSLSLRDARSRRALSQLMTYAPKTVFVDVNLRPPWWQRNQVLNLLGAADWVKLNGDELSRLTATAGGQAQAEIFLREYGLKGLLLTHGAHGAELFTASGAHVTVRPKQDIEVQDTVGAGDAFAAVMILGLVSEWPLEQTLRRAQDFASAIVGRRGATVNEPDFYQSFSERWATEA